MAMAAQDDRHLAEAMAGEPSDDVVPLEAHASVGDAADAANGEAGPEQPGLLIGAAPFGGLTRVHGVTE